MTISRMHAFVDAPADLVEPARAFWSALTGWPVGAAWHGHSEFASLEPTDGTAYLHVQRIDGPARVHLDLEGDPATEVSRLVGLGATAVAPGDGWHVLRSPAGLPFCVCGGNPSYEQTSAVRWPDGHRSRLLQLCVDVPAARYDAELAFWRAATGWADEPVAFDEFHRLVHRDEGPLQLLVQRLEDGDQNGAARAHLDLGTDDIEAEAARVEALGATRLWSREDAFVAFRDPVGLPFCVTGNDPTR